MRVRRACGARSDRRALAAGAVLLLLGPLTACETGDGGPPASGEPDGGVSARPVGPADGAHEHRAPGGRRGRGAVQGGGFAGTLPGSDAPDRTDDVGPQFALGDDLDLEEIERLVAAVERIARRQRTGQPVAVGGDLAAAVGTFGYRWFADGTVAPDPAWVAANIRTGRVPILGDVTCHKVMLPQLRGALREVAARGLAGKIHPDEYGGCYVPRFIARDPSRGLSLHTWGIAVDLNVPGNQRGVAGEIDRTVVSIFKSWGFAWGGDWAWTDPMHFEMNRLVRTR